MNGIANAYQVLQVDPSADPIVIAGVYRILARRFHPDGDAPDARRMAEINRAYELVRDPESRRRYDLQRVMQGPQPVPIHAAPRRTEAGVSRDAAGASDSPVLDFGRYTGWSVKDLARHDPDYLRWLCRHSSGIRFRGAISRVLPGEPDLERRANSVA